MSSSTLAEFVAARLGEDEETAKAVLPGDWSDIAWAGVGPSAVAFVTDFDPARVLRDVEAKRAILAEHRDAAGTCYRCRYGVPAHWEPAAWPCPTIRALAAVYSDHPGYQAEWKP